MHVVIQYGSVRFAECAAVDIVKRTKLVSCHRIRCALTFIVSKMMNFANAFCRKRQ